MNGAEVIKELARWLPLLWRFVQAFGGDKRAAARKVREIELEQRAARDRRMGRR